MQPVPAGVVAGEDERRERADRVGPCGEHAHREGRRPPVVLTDVEVAVAVELDDAPLARRRVGRELLVVDGRGRGDVEDPPAGVVQPLLEVGFVRVDEEAGVEVADLLGGGAAHEHRARLDPAHRSRVSAAALHGERPVQEECPGQSGRDAGEPPRARLRLAAGAQQLGARDRRLRIAIERVEERRGRARAQLRVLVEQQAVLASRVSQQGRVVLGLPEPRLVFDQAQVHVEAADGIGRAVVGGVVEHEDLVLDARGVGVADRGEAGEQMLAPVRVHDAIGERDRQVATIVADAGPDRRSLGLHAALRPRPLRVRWRAPAPT